LLNPLVDLAATGETLDSQVTLDGKIKLIMTAHHQEAMIGVVSKMIAGELAEAEDVVAQAEEITSHKVDS
jgi:hypothetical protein